MWKLAKPRRDAAAAPVQGLVERLGLKAKVWRDCFSLHWSGKWKTAGTLSPLASRVELFVPNADCQDEHWLIGGKKEMALARTCQRDAARALEAFSCQSLVH